MPKARDTEDTRSSRRRLIFCPDAPDYDSRKFELISSGWFYLRNYFRELSQYKTFDDLAIAFFISSSLTKINLESTLFTVTPGRNK